MANHKSDEMVPQTRIVNAMTVDVEDYFHVSALAPAIERARWDAMELRAEASTRRILDLFDEASVRATFFVLGWMADRLPKLVQEIARRGHEIACHGWSHELVYRQERSVFRAEAERCKKLLEDLTGARVLGYRAASYSITQKSLWALDDLIDLGFEYDSSVFPIRHDRYGIPGASPQPGPFMAPSGRKIMEFPLSTANVLGMRVPCCGGGYFRIFPYFLTRSLLRSINAAQRLPFIFYLHPWEVDPGQPRFNAGRLSTFRHYTNLDVCATRLRQLLRDFSFHTVSGVLSQLELSSPAAAAA